MNKKGFLFFILIASLSMNVLANEYNLLGTNKQKQNIKTNYNLIVYNKEAENFTDLWVAAKTGDLIYLQNAVKLDPNIINKINSSFPEVFIGSGSSSIDVFSFLIQNDPQFLTRQNHLGRNIVMDSIASYHEKITDKELNNETNSFINAVSIKTPELAEKLKKSNSDNQEQYEEAILFLIKKLDIKTLNQVDSYGNNVLHYATYMRMEKVVHFLLNKVGFNQKISNSFFDNALFSLVSHSCNNKLDEEKDLRILKLLLDKGVNPLQKNKLEISFAGIVYSNKKLGYLKTELDKNITGLKKKIFDADLIKLNSMVNAASFNINYNKTNFDNFICN